MSNHYEKLIDDKSSKTQANEENGEKNINKTTNATPSTGGKKLLHRLKQQHLNDTSVNDDSDNSEESDDSSEETDLSEEDDDDNQQNNEKNKAKKKKKVKNIEDNEDAEIDDEDLENSQEEKNEYEENEFCVKSNNKNIEGDYDPNDDDVDDVDVDDVDDEEEQNDEEVEEDDNEEKKKDHKEKKEDKKNQNKKNEEEDEENDNKSTIRKNHNADFKKKEKKKDDDINSDNDSKSEENKIQKDVEMKDDKRNQTSNASKKKTDLKPSSGSDGSDEKKNESKTKKPILNFKTRKSLESMEKKRSKKKKKKKNVGKKRKRVAQREQSKNDSEIEIRKKKKKKMEKKKQKKKISKDRSENDSEDEYESDSEDENTKPPNKKRKRKKGQSEYVAFKLEKSYVNEFEMNFTGLKVLSQGKRAKAPLSKASEINSKQFNTFEFIWKNGKKCKLVGIRSKTGMYFFSKNDPRYKEIERNHSNFQTEYDKKAQSIFAQKAKQHANIMIKDNDTWESLLETEFGLNVEKKKEKKKEKKNKKKALLGNKSNSKTESEYVYANGNSKITVIKNDDNESQSKEIGHSIYKIINPDGKIFFIRCSSDNLLDSKKSLLGWLLTMKYESPQPISSLDQKLSLREFYKIQDYMEKQFDYDSKIVATISSSNFDGFKKK